MALKARAPVTELEAEIAGLTRELAEIEAAADQARGALPLLNVTSISWPMFSSAPLRSIEASRRYSCANNSEKAMCSPVRQPSALAWSTPSVRSKCYFVACAT